MLKFKHSNLHLVLKCAIFGTVLLLPVLAAFFIHSVEAPYLYCFDRDKLGDKLGVTVVTVNQTGYGVGTYAARAHDDLMFPVKKCLVLYKIPLSNSNVSFKVGPDWIAVFNDSITECLPIFDKIYTSSMTYPSCFLEHEMKGWNASYQIVDDGEKLIYKIDPSDGFPDRITFSLPKSWLQGVPPASAACRSTTGNTITVKRNRE
ncbi:MAG: hypothetical protein AB7F32_05235 [Victivallaceae bacterium]